MIQKNGNPIRYIGTPNFVLCLLMAVTSKKRERRLSTRLTKPAVEFDFETTAKYETKQLTVEAEIKMALAWKSVR